MIFKLKRLEEILGRRLLGSEKENILRYASSLKDPKPNPEDPNYDSFMTCRHNVFLLYKQAAQKIGIDTKDIDKILEEYTPC